MMLSLHETFLDPLKGVMLPPCTILGLTDDNLARLTHRRSLLVCLSDRQELWKADTLPHSSWNHL